MANFIVFSDPAVQYYIGDTITATSVDSNGDPTGMDVAIGEYSGKISGTNSVTPLAVTGYNLMANVVSLLPGWNTPTYTGPGFTGQQYTILSLARLQVTNLSAVPANTSATVQWTAPSDYAGNGQVGLLYTVTATPTATGSVITASVTSKSTTTVSASLSGLADTTEYTIHVTYLGEYIDINDVSTLPMTVTINTPAAPPTNVQCFPSGTRILTVTGYKPVESLANGDAVITEEGRSVPIKMYRTRIEHTTDRTAPYRIAKGAFGNPVEICLSPLHAFKMRKGLWMIPRAAAKLSKKVVQYNVGEPIDYYHVECPHFLRDNLVIEGGAVVESYGANQLIKKETVYKWSDRFQGFTRIAAFSKISISL